jgi:hypothetical protein
VEPRDAYLLLDRQLLVAARCALGDGLSRAEVGQALEALSVAIQTRDCAEDMSPLSVPME